MAKIIDYVILEERNIQQLGSSVRQYLALGWQPYGPMLRESTFYQPMAKYEDGKPPLEDVTVIELKRPDDHSSAKLAEALTKYLTKDGRCVP